MVKTHHIAKTSHRGSRRVEVRMTGSRAVGPLSSQEQFYRQKETSFCPRTGVGDGMQGHCFPCLVGLSG